MNTFTLKVVEIKRETEDTVTLCFKQPALRKVKYKAGQYLSLLFRINGRRYIRPYSFSSTPGVETFIEVSIKRVLNGIVSNHIHDQVQIGDVIEVLEPMGDFVYEPKDTVKVVYFWGVGSGITPLISLIKEVLAFHLNIKVHLIYGNRNSESVIFSQTINNLLNVYREHFNVWYFYTQLFLTHESPYIVEGRINKEYALRILGNADARNTMHYICGPAGLKESVKEALSILNVPLENIFSEDFELIKDPKDFENILTQTVQIKFQNGSHIVEVTKGKSILESALDAGLELPFSCQTGNCDTCKATCLHGEIKMIGLTKERTNLNDKEYLLCCSHPLTDNVSLVI